MNSSLNTLERPASRLQVSPVLVRNGFTCTVVTLEPHAEATLPTGTSRDDQLLFVIDGEIAIDAGGLTTLVNRGAATLLAPGESPVLTVRSDSPARVLRVEIPARQMVAPQIITPGSGERILRRAD